MKKLFLASYALLTLDKATELLPKNPDTLKLTFIPTAENPEKEKSAHENRDKLVAMGFMVKDLDIANKSKDYVQKELENTDVVFVSGGNTFYLLEKARESGFDDSIKKLIEKGVVYIGSSAGSVLVCPTIEMVNGMDDPKEAPSLSSYEGLNIVDFLIVPHYGSEYYKELHKKIRKEWGNRGYELKFLTNNQAIIVDGDTRKVVEV